jgi:threonine synthase
LPTTYPKFEAKEIEGYKRLEYWELAYKIFKKFGVDINDADLKKICKKSYNKNAFPNSRLKNQASKITPVVKLKENLFLQELSNGPTYAFKDMAMQVLGNFFEYVLEKKKRKLNILGATSGDTGSAAEYALRGKKGVNVFMLSPDGKMSEFQRAQMYALQDENIFNIAVRGMFDDAQDVVKAVSMDKAFKQKYSIGAVNSINWARILAQVVYYFKGYCEVAKGGEQIDFVVPTGNFGNICAGHIARMCGLPIRNLILATNENDVLDEFFRTGVYRPRKSKETYVTTSPSMDISKASNFERFLFDLFGRSGSRVSKLMKELDKKGHFDVSREKEWKGKATFGFLSGKSKQTDRLKSIKEVYTKYGLAIDTHTADAYKVAKDYFDGKTKTIILETAQAIKFEDTFREATGKKLVLTSTLKKLMTSIQKVYISKPDASTIKNFIESTLKG